ncbi:MarR family winged helix-turn-helix transcriptional regulator [uncultured Mucilaginibacter sp.]|uniref:MarR family winged helix-turn-helix transcriptional regulator n=1 Tax=uncultured Mucilaginibacter sp. TaxID=797541 RepID=UPI0025FA95D1|nr:MarR family winged helix-turn-helix transcriptional regulator [uncultured Mucilaginibacter sp.]
MEEPLARRLLQVVKIYFGVFLKRVEYLEINRHHYMLLLIAEHDGKLTQKMLAEITGKDKSSMVSIIDTLTDKGYVYREINPDDRRQQLLKITDKAKVDMPAIKEAYKQLNAKATEGIDREKLEVFEEVLFKISNNLKPLESNHISLRLKKPRNTTRKP